MFDEIQRKHFHERPFDFAHAERTETRHRKEPDDDEESAAESEWARYHFGGRGCVNMAPIPFYLEDIGDNCVKLWLLHKSWDPGTRDSMELVFTGSKHRAILEMVAFLLHGYAEYYGGGRHEEFAMKLLELEQDEGAE